MVVVTQAVVNPPKTPLASLAAMSQYCILNTF